MKAPPASAPDPAPDPTLEPVLASVAAELADLAASGLRRSLRAARGPVGATMLLDGREVVNFSSNNYLGLADHPALAQAAAFAAAREGMGAGAARLIGGSLDVHRAFEEQVAHWKGTEAALLFGSGYQANLGILTALAGPEDGVYSDALNHASIIDGARLSRATVHVYPHNDAAALDALLRAGPRYRRRIVVTESVFSMDGDEAPLADIAGVCARHQALLAVDEAHAGGILGTAGAGLGAGVGAHVLMGTLGKALGVAGAYVASFRPIVDLLVNRARSFVFTTAPPVPLVAAAAEALRIAASEEGAARRRALGERIAQLRAGLEHLHLPRPRGPGHITPIVVGDSRTAVELSEALLERGLFVQAIRPPTVPAGTARLRLTLMATHTAQQVDALLAALASLRHRLPT